MKPHLFSNTLVLLRNDLAFAFKNKTFYLVLFIPLFVFASLNLADKVGPGPQLVSIGLIEHAGTPPATVRRIVAAEALFAVTWIASEAEGEALLTARRLDGVLTWNAATPDGLTLSVLKLGSRQTGAILQNVAAVQDAAEGRQPDWITTIAAVHPGDAQRETLPTWVLMLVLLTGFLILPMQVAEEKEKKLLLALLQTPIHEVEWLLAKLLLGIILILTAVVVLHALGQFGPVPLVDYLAFLLAGSFCFSAFGIFLGFLCRTQAGARTLGVIFFLPHLLPSAMSDVSEKLTAVAPLLPSWQLFHPLQAVLLEGGTAAEMPFDLLYLLGLGSLLFAGSLVLMKRRWLM